MNYNHGGPRKHPTPVLFLLFEFAVVRSCMFTWISTFKILGFAGPACSLTATFCIYSSIILLRKVCYSILSTHPLHPSSSFRLQPVHNTGIKLPTGRSRVPFKRFSSHRCHRGMASHPHPYFVFISRSYLLLLCQYLFHICFIFVSPIPHPCASFATAQLAWDPKRVLCA